MIGEANRSLERTPELLPILKEVGVVDSGGYGFTIILKGMKKALIGELVERNTATATEIGDPKIMAGTLMESEEFGYCTEFIMELGSEETNKKPFCEKKFIEEFRLY